MSELKPTLYDELYVDELRRIVADRDATIRRLQEENLGHIRGNQSLSRRLVEAERAPIRGSPARMWVNQPSGLQPCHYMHGTNVLAVREDATTATVYFLSGPTVSARVPWNSLSRGWVV